MNVQNCSTNPLTFTALFPDGSSQSITLAPSASIRVTGAVVGGTNFADSFDSAYVAVNDDVSGFGVHALPSVSSVFLGGFFAVAPLTAVLACVWWIRRSLSVGTKGYSTSE